MGEGKGTQPSDDESQNHWDKQPREGSNFHVASIRADLIPGLTTG